MLYETTKVIEILCGREGMWGLKNTNLIPLGGALKLRNATLTEHSFRTGGGAAKVGGPPVSAVALAAIDYFPTPSAQRTVVAFANGSIWKDNGAGGGWVEIATGLTTAGAIPHFTVGGAESAGQNRKLFYADGVNAPRYLNGDAASMTTMNPATQQSADWTSNPPSWFVQHEGYLFAGGCKGVGTTEVIYRCTARADHTDFRSGTPFSAPIFAGEAERIVGALSYKGGLILFKYPDFVYFYDTQDPDSTRWRALRAAQPGGVSVAGACLAEDDIFWISMDGSVHLLSATQNSGSVRATDLAYRKLGTWVRDNVETSNLDRSQVVYHSGSQEIMIGCSFKGQASKHQRLHLDLNRRMDQGERWISWDRDRNEALFLRKIDGVLRPHMVDEVGQVWELDTEARNKDGDGYEFEWFLKDDDFSAIIPSWHGRKKNLRFIQLEYFPRATTTHTVIVFRDGIRRQEIPITLTASGAGLGTPQATLPFVLGIAAIAMSVRKRLLGQCVRLALQGVTAGADEDISLTRILIGLDLSG